MSDGAVRAPARARRHPRSAKAAPWLDFLTWTEAKGDGSWLFRGHEDVTFTLRPTSGRKGDERARREKQIFRQFKRQARIHLQNSSGLSDWEWLTLAQHYGVPTRLLDWTYNPLVACFFAIMRESPRDAEVIAVRATAAEFVDDEREDGKDPFALSEVMFLEAPAIAARVSAQSGLFTVHPEPTKPWEPPTEGLDRFLIPRTAASEFRERLMGIGVHASSIWGDLQGLGEHLRWHFDSGRPFASDGQATFIKLPAVSAVGSGDTAALMAQPAEE